MMGAQGVNRATAPHVNPAFFFKQQWEGWSPPHMGPSKPYLARRTLKDNLSVYCPSVHYCVLCPVVSVSTLLCTVSGGVRQYTIVYCVRWCPSVHYCVLCPVVSVSTLLCTVSGGVRQYAIVYCVRWCPSVRYCALCPVVSVSTLLCTVSGGVLQVLIMFCSCWVDRRC